ncbi:MAG: type II toxin-antitoxin system RelE/ParE family toxin [Hydrogenoanaerobacterium sp.]
MPNKKSNVFLTLRAQHDLHDIATYYKLRVGTESAKRITDKLLNRIELLADFPELGTVIASELIMKAGYNMLVIEEYLCFYSMQNDMVFVHHIVHGSTDYIKLIFSL